MFDNEKIPEVPKSEFQAHAEAIQEFLEWCCLERDIHLLRALDPDERVALAREEGGANVPEYVDAPPLKEILDSYAKYKAGGA